LKKKKKKNFKTFPISEMGNPESGTRSALGSIAGSESSFESKWGSEKTLVL
jgi:hypothetical protein